MVTTVTDENRTAADGDAGARLRVAAAADPHTFFACLISLVSQVGSGSFTSGSVKLDLRVSFLRGWAWPRLLLHAPTPPRGETTLMGTETLSYMSRRHVSNNNCHKGRTSDRCWQTQNHFGSEDGGHAGACGGKGWKTDAWAENRNIRRYSC